MFKNMLFITMGLLLFIVSRSNGSLLNRLVNSVKSVDRRSLISISFNNKICVRYGGYDWLTPYSGDYTYNGIINGKASYILSTCTDANNCHNGKTLSIGTDNKWYFNGQPSGTIRDPFCQIATDSPNDCKDWWGGRQPTITECGENISAENGISQQDTDAQKACTDALNAAKRTSLTSADKTELLRQFNVQRALWNQSPFAWSTVQEGIALDSANFCQSGHPMTTQMARDSCVRNGGNYDDCQLAGTQGAIGPSNNVNGFVWDGYTARNNPCRIGNGTVWSFMQDAHREPMTGEGGSYSKVGCAYSYCGGQGNMYCNYM